MQLCSLVKSVTFLVKSFGHFLSQKLKQPGPLHSYFSAQILPCVFVQGSFHVFVCRDPSMCLCAGILPCVCVQGSFHVFVCRDPSMCLCAGILPCVCVQGSFHVFVCRDPSMCLCAGILPCVCVQKPSICRYY